MQRQELSERPQLANVHEVVEIRTTVSEAVITEDRRVTPS